MSITQMINEELARTREVINKAQEYEKQASPEQKQQLDEIYKKNTAKRDRLAIALDILEGRSFVVYDHEGELTILRPGEKTSKLLDEVEQKMGGRIYRYGDEKTFLGRL